MKKKQKSHATDLAIDHEPYTAGEGYLSLSAGKRKGAGDLCAPRSMR